MLDLSFPRWRAATEAERRALVASLARQLPTGFAPLDVHGVVATFAAGGRTFALVPGGQVTIGWDPGGWQPDARERASYADSAREYGLDEDLVDFVAARTLRRREVELAPLLVETAAAELAWEPADDEDAEVRHLRAKLPPGHAPYTAGLARGGREVRVRRVAGGAIVAERSVEVTHEALVRQLAAEGFRLPTSDEWEHACGAGAATLFRWGDHAPCDRYPVDGGDDFDAHVRPNALGVSIASDPYKYEVVAEADRTRGGDGGSMVCGGAGFFLGWLTLATAYFEEHACVHDPARHLPPGYTIGRRVLPLA